MAWTLLNTGVDILQMIASPVSGGTTTMDGTKNVLILNNSGLLATYTVKLPAAPVDGQRAIITAGGAITLLTIDGNGNTVKGVLTTLSANGYIRYTFSVDANAWFRTG